MMKRFLIERLYRSGLFPFVQDTYQWMKYGMDLSLRAENRRFVKKGAPDDLPFPPSRMINLVAGHFDVRKFFESGLLGASCIQHILGKNNLDMEGFSTLLDFGCGCGRIVRHWKSLKKPMVYGSDCNKHLVQWCSKNLPFAEFEVNGPHPPLGYEGEKFWLIYAISVFTHLSEALQMPWMEELWRILKPGGYLLLTVHGASRLQQLQAEERAKFNAGHLVILREKYSGTNICGAFHPQEFVRKTLAKKFSFIDFLPMGAKDANQDMYLFCKPKE
jgi:SAM-dependent methyltransferase